MQEPKFIAQPLYVQLREALIQRITSGDWRPGAALPNEIDIAREYGLSAGTVRKALDWMEEAHLVTRQQGRGTFVRNPSALELALRFENIRLADGAHVPPQHGAMTSDVREADAYACDKLKLKPGAKVRHIEQVRLSGGQPFMLEVSVLPFDLFAKVPQSDYTITVAAWDSGVLLGKGEEVLNLAALDAATAQKLAAEAGRPCLVLNRVILTIDGRPAEWRVAHCLMERHCYVSAVGSAATPG